MKKVMQFVMCMGLMISAMTMNIFGYEDNQPALESNEIIILDNFDKSEPYSIDINNNLVAYNSEAAVVDVVYDGAWTNTRASNVPRIINVSVVCKGTGYFSDPMYNCTLKVALELRYDSDRMVITSVGTPDVYSYISPGAPQNASNPRATASITNGGKSVKITGYINYSAAGISQTFTGSTTYSL